MKELTTRQKKVLDFLASYIKKHGYPPTVREIGEHFGFLWTAARSHLQALEKKGFIRINPLKSRGLEIAGLRPSNGLMLPVAGRIRAGRPILAAEDIDEYLFVDKSLFPSEGSFALRVTGDSMQEAGIFEGDYVIVRPANSIENGEIGIALVENEATVKRIFMDGGKIILKPENRHMKPASYDPEEVSIIGKVIGVIRKL
ncbi:MAG TPA: transcriptional repressor LexA [Dissulfurispiraceae bacterium]